MNTSDNNLLLEVWALDKGGHKVHPYKGLRGKKHGLYSVNFTSDTNKFQGLNEEELIRAILQGRFRDRGTIRMRRSGTGTGAPQANAFAPRFYLDRAVKDC